MKRLLIIGLSILVFTCLVVSCNGEVDYTLWGDEYTIRFDKNSLETVNGTYTDMVVRLGDVITLTTNSNTYVIGSDYTLDGFGKTAIGPVEFEFNTPILIDSDFIRLADENKVITLYAKWTYHCFAKGTLITLPDGTKRAIENIKVGDEVLTYNFYTGTFEAKKVLLLEKGSSKSAPTYEIKTDSGRTITVVAYHSFFSPDLMQCLDIGYYNYKQKAGSRIVVQDGSSFVIETIVSITQKIEPVEYYSFVTEENFNCFANDCLTFLPVYGCYLPFDVDDNFVVNAQKMEQDIQNYGLYTYEDFPFEVSREMFDKLQMKYFKILVSKGICSLEYLGTELEYYPSTFPDWY